MESALIETSEQLQAAFTTGHLKTYGIAAGTYTGDFTVTRWGNEAVSIVFKPVAGAHVIIDGSLTLNSEYVDIQDIEICYSGWTTRQTAISGSSPADMPLTKQLTINGIYNRVVNCVIHDLLGVGLWTSAAGSTLYGCLIYHIGWNGPDRGHGHALYTQNDAPERIIKHNVLLSCFGWGIHAYTETGTINNLTLIENTVFAAGALLSHATNILLGGSRVAQNPKLIGNNTYRGDNERLGYSAGVSDAMVDDNYFPNGLEKVKCTFVSETGNFYGPAPVSGQRVTVWPNTATSGRGIITVYNWDNADSISVDVSNVLSAGSAYQLHNAQDYYGDVAMGNVAQGGTITIDMRAASHSVAAVAGNWPSEASTFPTFGCFILKAT